MKRFVIVLLFFLALTTTVRAQGLRHSVCIVTPEYQQFDKDLMTDYSLAMARAGITDAARTLAAYKSDDIYGSGVVVSYDGKKYVLTNLHVAGYAKSANITFQLHERTLRYPHCPIVKTSKTCDLALIALPSECDMVVLPLFQEIIDEDMSITAVGFPELANKPSWQLTRGIISNAHVDVDKHASHTIQHTASIDPGSSGGPLLYKGEDGQYSILGINTWKAFYREGVGLAIGVEDIQSFMNSSATSEPEYKVFDAVCTTSGEDWLYIFRQLPEEKQKWIKQTDWRLPLDPALKVLELRDSIIQTNVKEAKRFKRSESHIITDLEHKRHVRLIYDNYFGINQQVGAQLGFDWLGFIETGVQVSALIASCMTENPDTGERLGYKNCGGAMFGIYLGGQIPISVGEHILAPRITQSAGGGPFKTGNINGGFAILTDTRIGLDWRIPFIDCDLIVGAHYDMNWIWSKDRFEITPYKWAADSEKFNQYLQHGISITIGVAW